MKMSEYIVKRMTEEAERRAKEAKTQKEAAAIQWEWAAAAEFITTMDFGTFRPDQDG